LLEGKTPKEIAKEDHIVGSSVYNMLEQLRRKYREARQFVNLFDSKYRKEPKLRKYLWVALKED
jgi:hypothetical protein